MKCVICQKPAVKVSKETKGGYCAKHAKNLKAEQLRDIKKEEISRL